MLLPLYKWSKVSKNIVAAETISQLTIFDGGTIVIINLIIVYLISSAKLTKIHWFQLFKM